MVWGWICVCLVTLAVAYSMAEMCSAYEIPIPESETWLTIQISCCWWSVQLGGYISTNTLG